MVQEKRIQSIVSIMPALDFKATIDFYLHLGFAVVGEYPDYLLLERDGSELHFFASDDKHLAENTACYIRVRNLEALADEYESAGVKLRHPVELKPWGMKEFAVIDVSGNLLRFGELPGE